MYKLNSKALIECLSSDLSSTDKDEKPRAFCIYLRQEHQERVILVILTNQGTPDATELTPRIVEELLNHRIIDISAGDSHALALTHDSTVYAWGNNSVGQCGQVRKDKEQLSRYMSIILDSNSFDFYPGS